MTAAKAREAQPKHKPYKLSDEKGLYLEVRPNGAKYWRLKYRFGGKEKRLALGVYPEVSLKFARAKQLEARGFLNDGVDPSEVRRLQKLRTKTLSESSFGAIGIEWFDKKRKHWSRTHSDRVNRLLTKDLAPMATRPIAGITAPELLQVLRKVEARGALETAHRVKQIAGQVFRTNFLALQTHGPVFRQVHLEV